MKRAHTNTEIYKRVFGREIELVDDVVKMQDLKERKVFKTCSIKILHYVVPGFRA